MPVTDTSQFSGGEHLLCSPLGAAAPCGHGGPGLCHPSYRAGSSDVCGWLRTTSQVQKRRLSSRFKPKDVRNHGTRVGRKPAKQDVSVESAVSDLLKRFSKLGSVWEQMKT